MSLIDWSDPDEMLGLLLEYVLDEVAASHDDPERNEFLSQLSRDLQALAGHNSGAAAIALSLREVIDSQPTEFAGDPVIAHLEACVEELDRIDMQRTPGRRA